MHKLFPKAAVLTALAAMLMLAACRSPYVNIPSEWGSVASTDPNGKAVRVVSIEAIKAAAVDAEIDGQFAIKMPEGASQLTEIAVASGVSEMAVAASDAAAEGLPVFEVTGVRVRAWQGEVDVQRPGKWGGTELVTAYLDYSPTDGWTVQRQRAWRGVTPQQEVEE